MGDGFSSYMNQLRATEQLDRIVIDECHTILHDGWDFRRKLRRMGELGRVGVQMVMLTATLPPSAEGRLWERMGWQGGQVQMFRAPTSRSNIAYRSVWIADEEARMVSEKPVIQQAFQRYQQGKMVVYCNSVPKTQDLAEELGCEAYHHAAVDKAGILGRFKNGNQHRIIVATSAFGMGVDIPNIRVIVHTDRPRTLLDYGQESGRAGRDGLPSEAFIIQRMAARMEGEDGGQDRGWMTRFIEGQECRRRVLDEYLDGRTDQVQYEGDKTACEQCRGGSSRKAESVKVDEDRMYRVNIIEARQRGDPVDEAEGNGDTFHQEEGSEWIRFQQQGQMQQQMQQQRRQKIQQEAREVMRLQKHLDEVQGQCPFCRWAGLGMSQRQHRLYRCRVAESVGSRRLYERMKQQIRQGRGMAAYSGCVDCFAPQEWCQQWQRRDEEDGGGYQKVRGGKCQYRDMILGGFAVELMERIGFPEQVGERIERREFSSGSMADSIRYMGQQIE